MSYKTFRIWQRVIAAIIAAVIAFSVVDGNSIAPIPTVIVAMAIIIILRRRVKEVVADERAHAIAGKASRLTMQITGIAMAAAGGTLLAMSRGSGEPMLGYIGYTLCYATCALLIINYIAYYYYSRKLGGRP
jgi:uncharacterized membrane protein